MIVPNELNQNASKVCCIRQRVHWDTEIPAPIMARFRAIGAKLSTQKFTLGSFSCKVSMPSGPAYLLQSFLGVNVFLSDPRRNLGSAVSFIRYQLTGEANEHNGGRASGPRRVRVSK